MKGEVIGVNQSIRTTSYTSLGDPVNTGIGFAISARMVKRVIPDLIQFGKHDYPFLGISSIDNLSLQEIEMLGLQNPTGAYVTNIVVGGPADKAGIQVGTQPTGVEGLYAGGDLLVAIDGMVIRYFDELLGYLYANKSPGDKVTLTVLRGADRVEIDLTLGTRP